MLTIPTSELRRNAARKWCDLYSYRACRYYVVNNNEARVASKPHIKIRTPKVEAVHYVQAIP